MNDFPGRRLPLAGAAGSCRVALVLLGLFLFSACVPVSFGNKRPVKSMTPVYIVDDFPGEIRRLERIAREDPSPEVRAEAHFQLAALWSHHGNPKTDYERALKELDTYLQLKPQATLMEQNISWRAMLREMQTLREARDERAQELEYLKAENALLKERVMETRGLQSSLDGMQHKIDVLSGENEKMREAIEKLKSLDLWLEEQRGQIQ